MKRFLITAFAILGLMVSGAGLQNASGQTVSLFLYDLNISEGGYISAAPESAYYIYADFINQSTQFQAWQTEAAELHFKTFTSNRHEFYLPGRDSGAEPVGFINNFAWQKIQIDPGNTLVLRDGNTVRGGAQYGEVITGALIQDGVVTNIEGNGMVLYYAADLPGNEYLDGRSYTLSGGGALIPVSPYCTGEDLDLDGICDTEDNCPCTHNPDQEDDDLDGHGNLCPLADYNSDQDVDGTDLFFFTMYYQRHRSQADLDEDGIIDLPDLEKFARESGWKYESLKR